MGTGLAASAAHPRRNKIRVPPPPRGGGAQSLRGREATKPEEGVPPPTVGSFLIFRLELLQSGAYLRRKFRLDDMYYIIITFMELKISHGLILLGGGGASAPPPPPHQYASDTCTHRWIGNGKPQSLAQSFVRVNFAFQKACCKSNKIMNVHIFLL